MKFIDYLPAGIKKTILSYKRFNDFYHRGDLKSATNVLKNNKLLVQVISREQVNKIANHHEYNLECLDVEKDYALVNSEETKTEIPILIKQKNLEDFIN
jgi:hypothetical protein